METRVLRYFLEMAREGNMSRAAKKLHITQPTMSKQLRDLESELGVKLYARTNYNIELTEAGHLLEKRAHDIVDLVDKTVLEFKNYATLAEGTIYVGSAESESFSFVAKTIKNLRITYPGIHLHLFSGNIQDVLEQLDKGILDFAFIMDYEESTKYDSLKIPTVDHWGLLIPKKDALSQRDSLCLDDLFGLPLICSRQNMMIDFPRWFGNQANKLQIIATYNLLYNAAIMVRENVGYALTYDKITNTALDSKLTFVPLVDVNASAMFCLWRKQHTFSNVAHLFLNELKLQLK
ncbi:LysR family transcriptional regulator [Veillonella criceti]|uniref:Cys regulon transcriptional activator n=1 Tax=Veillonella criceti TaxID=103891 RepID=A0A380NKJ8_9FIRM|nr:LysR family transcriptional regulator [Veillonella criceti]SUP43278.1 Cys regulon transcriptional activator [Veillonella criceti]